MPIVKLNSKIKNELLLRTNSKSISFDIKRQNLSNANL